MTTNSVKDMKEDIYVFHHVFSYWDPAYDEELMSDRIALNLIYTQTVADIERGWILCGKETQAQLASLQARGAKREVFLVD